MTYGIVDDKRSEPICPLFKIPCIREKCIGYDPKWVQDCRIFKIMLPIFNLSSAPSVKEIEK